MEPLPPPPHPLLPLAKKETGRIQRKRHASSRWLGANPPLGPKFSLGFCEQQTCRGTRGGGGKTRYLLTYAGWVGEQHVQLGGVETDHLFQHGSRQGAAMLSHTLPHPLIVVVILGARSVGGEAERMSVRSRSCGS